MSSNCNSSSLSTYVPSSVSPWNLKKINHLFKRIGFGIRPVEAVELLNKSPSDVIDTLIDEALTLPPTSHFENPVSNLTAQARNWRWLILTETNDKPIQGRMTLFWHNHFVVIYNREPQYLYNYTSTLQKNAFGNFKDFTRTMGLEDAMLVFLNGFQNVKTAPNENYARELYELFTLGEGNGYTEEDIKETARALTGYNSRNGADTPISFVPENFDEGKKTIFGRTGNWDYNDVIDILFEEKAALISKFIVEKMYRYFVHPELPENQEIIEGLAHSFRANDFEIAPLLKLLFKSEHFFDDAAMDVIIKSPIDLFLITHNTSNFDVFSSRERGNYISYIQQLGQDLFNHPDVSGWSGDKTWVSSPNFISYWRNQEEHILFTYGNNTRNGKGHLLELAKILSDNSDDYKIVTREIMNWYLPSALLKEIDYEIAQDIFKADVPENYFEDNTWSLYHNDAPLQVRTLLQHIIKLPEFYLK